MAIAIRLARGGMKKRPYYRIVVTDSRQPRDGRFLEKLGTYNPLLPKDSPERVKLDAERAGYWLGVGAQPSDRVARFLDAAGVRVRAAKSNPNKGEPGANAKERTEARTAKETARAEAAAAAAAAPPPHEPEAVEPEAVEPEVAEMAEDVAVETAEPAGEAVEVDAPAGETSAAETADEAPAGDATVETLAIETPTVEPVAEATPDAAGDTDAEPAA